MEIKDYLKVLGKRAWLLVMIPAVAGVVAGLIAVQQPQAFRTSGTLQLPRDEAATPALIAQKVADFRAAATNPTVENTVSQQTGVPVAKIQRLKIAQVGDSSQLTMSLVDKSKDPTSAKAVVEGVAKGALDYLQAPEVEAGQRAVKAANDKIAAAQSDVASATNDLQSVYVKLNTSTPDDDIRNLRALITDAQSSLYKAQATGDTVGQQIYQRAIDENGVKLLALLNGSANVNLLQAKIVDAQAALKTATDERDAATKQLDGAAATADLTFSSEAQAVVRKTRVVKTAAAAVVAGFPIAIGLVLGLDALSRRRRQRQLGTDEVAGVGPPDDERDAIERAEVSPAVIPARVAPAREQGGTEPALMVGNRAARDSETLELERNGQTSVAEPAVMLVAPGYQNGQVDADDDEDIEDIEDAEDADDELVALPAAVDDLDTDVEHEQSPSSAQYDAQLLDDDLADESDAPDADDDDVAVADAFDKELDDTGDLGDDKDVLADEDDLAGDALSDEDDELDDDDEVVSTNGWARKPARVPDSDKAFEEDDEGPEVDG